jgi:hypothetical protein
MPSYIPTVISTPGDAAASADQEPIPCRSGLYEVSFGLVVRAPEPQDVDWLVALFQRQKLLP